MPSKIKNLYSRIFWLKRFAKTKYGVVELAVEIDFGIALFDKLYS